MIRTAFLAMALAMPSVADDHPNLVLTEMGVSAMQAGWQASPAFRIEVERAMARIDALIELPIAVPLPADAGGGYTHEQHKANGTTILEAATLYQITGEKKYAEHARALLLAYADMYPGLGIHPKPKEQSAGKLFWQNLNESVWLVYVAQGYDAVVDALSEKDRARIEKDLLRPVAHFLSHESPETINKVHNHGTWAAAAVGMTGYALGDRDLIDIALKGLDKSGEAGFLKQLDELFSADGYYSEGPYYQRYALMPFVLFAKAIQSNEPERKIFEYRDGVLMKAIYTTVDLSYNGLFFPINDALKDKGVDTRELMYGLSIAYGLNGDKGLLSVSQQQSGIVLTGDGLKMAQAIDAGDIRPYAFKSRQLRDGATGKRGALTVMRGEDQALVMKNTAQGMGHGHFDRLNWLFYDAGEEIVTDYGAARFLNVEAKYGGHYLPENKTWAKQTIAHNTIVVDETSHFDGNTKRGEATDTSVRFYADTDRITISSAKVQPYKDMKLRRTMAMLRDPDLEYPVVIDVFHADGKAKHQYDLPLHYNGHLIDTNFALAANEKALVPLGEKNGYQHLWLKAKSDPLVGGHLARITWMKDRRFYTLNTITDAGQRVLFTELGATDPNFNLRRENSFVLRRSGVSDTSFVSVLEPHGEYNPALEYTREATSQIAGLSHYRGKSAELVLIETVHGRQWGLALAKDGSKGLSHQMKIEGEVLSWTGPWHLFDLTGESE